MSLPKLNYEVKVNRHCYTNMRNDAQQSRQEETMANPSVSDHTCGRFPKLTHGYILHLEIWENKRRIFNRIKRDGQVRGAGPSLGGSRLDTPDQALTDDESQMPGWEEPATTKGGHCFPEIITFYGPQRPRAANN